MPYAVRLSAVEFSGTAYSFVRTHFLANQIECNNVFECNASPFLTLRALSQCPEEQSVPLNIGDHRPFVCFQLRWHKFRTEERSEDTYVPNPKFSHSKGKKDKDSLKLYSNGLLPAKISWDACISFATPRKAGIHKCHFFFLIRKIRRWSTSAMTSLKCAFLNDIIRVFSHVLWNPSRQPSRSGTTPYFTYGCCTHQAASVGIVAYSSRWGLTFCTSIVLAGYVSSRILSR